MANELARAKRKLLAVRRAERRLKTRLEDIDWEFDYLLPEVSALELAAAEKLELPEFTVEEDES